MFQNSTENHHSNIEEITLNIPIFQPKSRSEEKSESSLSWAIVKSFSWQVVTSLLPNKELASSVENNTENENISTLQKNNNNELVAELTDNLGNWDTETNGVVVLKQPTVSTHSMFVRNCSTDSTHSLQFKLEL